MKKNSLSIVALILWLLTMIIAAIFFIKGTTAESEDGRTSVLLSEGEKNYVLDEMRMMLDAVQQMTNSLANDDMGQFAKAARSIGTANSADVNPALMMKLPVGFKQPGMALHVQFDHLAEAAEKGASQKELLEMLSAQLAACVSCHAQYRLEVESSD